MPKASAALWAALGARARSGALADQRIADAGRWGRLPRGVRLTKGAALFPRLRGRAEARPAIRADA